MQEEFLVQLGFSSQEAKLYLALLKSGPATLLQASRTSGLERTRLYRLVDQLAAKPDVYSCFASQYLDYTTGRGPTELNECEKQLVADQFIKSGYKLDELVLGVIGSPSFTARKN